MGLPARTGSTRSARFSNHRQTAPALSPSRGRSLLRSIRAGAKRGLLPEFPRLAVVSLDGILIEGLRIGSSRGSSGLPGGSALAAREQRQEDKEEEMAGHTRYGNSSKLEIPNSKGLTRRARLAGILDSQAGGFKSFGEFKWRAMAGRDRERKCDEHHFDFSGSEFWPQRRCG
jgi:hypothetical protein